MGVRHHVWICPLTSGADPSEQNTPAPPQQHTQAERGHEEGMESTRDPREAYLSCLGLFSVLTRASTS